MDIKRKYRVLVFLFGMLASIHSACNISAKTGKEVEEMEVEIQEVVENPVVENGQTSSYKPILLSEEQFKQWVVDFTSSNKKFKGEKPCVIDFYADWCRPCKLLAPLFDEMAGKYGDRVNFYKINTDKYRNLSLAYNVTVIPTLLFFDKEGKINQMVGMPSEEELENAVKSILNQIDEQKN